VNYYRRHIGDYLRDTAHLSLLEHGVYTRLLDLYYTRESPIPADQSARLIGARSSDEKEAVELVLSEFFTLTAEGWRQGRCDKEIAAYTEKAEKNRLNGPLGGRPKKPSHNHHGSEAEPTKNPDVTYSQEPIANNHKPEEKKEEERAPEGAPPPSVPAVATTKRRKPEPATVPIPADFSPSPAVLAWASSHGFGGPRIGENLDALRDYAERTGRRYASWDAALRTAIRENWAADKRNGSSHDGQFEGKYGQVMAELTGGRMGIRAPPAPALTGQSDQPYRLAFDDVQTDSD